MTGLYQGFLQWDAKSHRFMPSPTSQPIVRVTPGAFLTLHYRLTGPQGDIINTFADKPATLSLGSGELSPALEQHLMGLAEGARTSFQLAEGEAFGPRNPDMVQWVSRDLLRQMGDPHESYAVGDVLPFRRPMALAAMPARCASWATLRCCLTSTTPWPVRLSNSKCN